MRAKVTIAALCLAAGFAAQAAAQAASTPSQEAQAIDPAVRAAALRVVKASTPPENFRAIVNAIASPLIGQLLTARGAPPEAVRDITGIVEDELNTMGLDEVYDGIASVYARHFTLAELTALAAFYETPAGKHLVSEQPALAREGMLIGEAWGQNVLAPRIAARVEALLQARKRQNP
jgi:hypothetical protein